MVDCDGCEAFELLAFAIQSDVQDEVEERASDGRFSAGITHSEVGIMTLVLSSVGAEASVMVIAGADDSQTPSRGTKSQRSWTES